MENDNAIEIKNVSKTFKIFEDMKYTLRSLISSLFYQGKTKEFRALHNINFDIKKGEFVGILGRNGSGKSTLLKIIAGIYKPDAGGVVKVKGKLVPFLELGVGFNPELSGRENIYLNGTILGMTRKFLDSKFDEIIDFAEIKEFIDTPVKNYSSGMMVRLAFSIAVQTDADIFILDEILAVGDATFQSKSTKVINALKKEGKTIIFVSHDINTVNEFCDKVILLDKSEMVAIGNTKDILDVYNKLLTAKINESMPHSKHLPIESSNDTGNKIVDVQILNADDIGIKAFQRGEVIKFRVIVDIKIIDKDMFVGASILEGSKELSISANNTSYDKFEHDWKHGLNEIELTLSPARINKGNFFVLVSLFAKEPVLNNYYDYYDSRKYDIYFEVLNSDKRGGMILLDHKWKHGAAVKEVTLD